MSTRALHLLVFVLAVLVGSLRIVQGADQAEPRYPSPNHICLAPDGITAYVVNQTADSVSILDVPGRRLIGRIEVGIHPTHAAVSPDGRTLYVTSLWGSTVEVVDLSERAVVRSIGTGYEPYGVTLSSDGSRLYVANSLANTVSVLAAESGALLFEVPVGRGPRFVAEVPGTTLAVVSCSLGRSVSIIDVISGHLVETRNLGRANLLRQISCSPDGRWALVAHVLSHDEAAPLQMERGFIHSNGFSILDLQQPGHYVTLLLDRLLLGAANPWGMAVGSQDRRLYVSLAGVHEIAIVNLVDALSLVADTHDHATAQRYETDVDLLDRLGIIRRVDAGGLGPRGIVLCEATGELLVANYFSDTVSVLDADSGEIRSIIPLGPSAEMTPRRQGEMLFNDARLCFQQWFSCASCHEEDAGVDGLNWDLPNDGLGNFKNVKSLHDAYDTPPAMWGGVRRDLDAAVAAGQRFLGFLPEPDKHRALLAFLGSPRRPPNPYRGRAPDAVRRGRDLFHTARCHHCHPPPTYTDLRKHDVGLAAPTDLRSRFDTPSLRECYRTGPYLHDGRAPSLRAIFTDHNPADLHGRTSNLTEDQLDDLLEFLRTR